MNERLAYGELRRLSFRSRPRPSAGLIRLVSYLAALGIGIGFVLSLFPPDLLLHGAVPDARLTGDVAQHVIGQRAFLGDAWRWPLLKTTLLDWPDGLNVAMTDANPLVVLPLKLFAPWLPAGFSAVQMWLAFAYAIQPVAAVFALRCTGETRLLPCVAVSLFAIAAPALLFRHPHSALSSHFLLLTAIGSYFLAVRGARGQVAVPLVLLPASMLVHPYLAFMTAAVLLAAPVTLAFRGDRRCVRAAAVLAGALVLTAALTTVLGYAAQDPTGGFGEVSMNLLSPVYPTYSRLVGHGLEFIDATGSQYEGYNYLGLGLIALVLIGVLAAMLSTRTAFLRRHVGLALACIALTGLALSNIVYLNHAKLLDLGPPPDFMHQLRSSGRLFWPVAYVLMIGSVATVVRIVPAPFGVALVLLTAWTQMRDARDLERTIKRDLRATTVEPLDGGRLDALLGAHGRLTMLPAFGCGANAVAPEFSQLLLASSRLRVAANTMYVARFSRPSACVDAETAQRPLDDGELRVFLPVEASSGPALVPDGARVCRRLQTVSVCTTRTGLLDGLPPAAAAPAPPGETIQARPDMPGLLGPGWYPPQEDGAWTIAHEAVIAADLGPTSGDGVTLALAAQGFTGTHGTTQHVALSVNGHPVAAWDLPDRETISVQAAVPAVDLVSGPQLLRFSIAAPARPSAAGVNRDTRELGMFLMSLRFDPA